MSNKISVRADQIMKAILRAGDTSVQQLVDQVGAPAHTIRRDLARLEQQGLILRTHGGATPVQLLLRHDTSFHARELRSAEQKRRIGFAASELVTDMQTVGITAGTTMTQIARSLRHRRGISVVTNAANIGMELCIQPAIKTMLTSGTLASAWTFALAGQAAITFLQDVFLDIAFIGVTGFDLERGITTLEPEEAAVSVAMIRNSKRVVVVADSIKIGLVSRALICPLSSIHTLISDTDLPKHIQDELTARGIEVILA